MRARRRRRRRGCDRQPSAARTSFVPPRCAFLCSLSPTSLAKQTYVSHASSKYALLAVERDSQARNHHATRESRRATPTVAFFSSPRARAPQPVPPLPPRERWARGSRSAAAPSARSAPTTATSSSSRCVSGRFSSSPPTERARATLTPLPPPPPLKNPPPAPRPRRPSSPVRPHRQVARRQAAGLAAARARGQGGHREEDGGRRRRRQSAAAATAAAASHRSAVIQGSSSHGSSISIGSRS